MNIVMPEICEHKWIYRGVGYEVQYWKLPGSGAQPIYYYDVYFCERCLTIKTSKLNISSNTYGKILFGATPVEVPE